MAYFWQQTPRPLRIAGYVIAALIVLLVAFVLLLDWNWARRFAARVASEKLHRQVTIDGLSGHLLRSVPTVTVTGLHVSNPDWAASSGNMLDVDGITVAVEFWPLVIGHVIIDQLEIDRPQVLLLRDKTKRANWDFSDDQEKPKPPQKPGKPTKLPAIHLFTLKGGSLKIDDTTNKLTFDAAVNADERQARSSSAPTAFDLRGHGELNQKPFELEFRGSSLINVRLDQPYDYSTELRAGPLQAAAHGEIDKPFDLAHLSASVDFKGENLASLYYLTGLALPFTPPFHVSGDLRRDGMLFKLNNLQGTVGNSDLEGTVRVDASEARPKFNADLLSHSLDLADLAPSVGAGVNSEDGNHVQADLQAPKNEMPKNKSDKLIPTYPFEFDRLRSMDANVELRAESVKTQKIPIKAVELKLVLANGELTLDPANFTLPQGKFGGAVRIEARDPKAAADMSLDLRLTDVDLAQFKSDKMPEAPLTGPLLSRIKLEGHGSSIHDILATSNGELLAVIPHGEMRQAFAELTGINAARGLGLLLSGSEKQAQIRCAIVAFNVQNGNARAEPLVFDTDQTNVTGSGSFSFQSEDIDLTLHGNSKKFDPLHVHAPITIKGTLGDPSFGLDPKALAVQGGAAAALAVVATPIASIAAFIDPGLGKNADCAALLAGEKVESTAKPPPPQVQTHQHRD